MVIDYKITAIYCFGLYVLLTPSLSKTNENVKYSLSVCNEHGIKKTRGDEPLVDSGRGETRPAVRIQKAPLLRSA